MHKPTESINSKVEVLLKSENPIEWIYVIFKPNGTLQPVDPMTYRKHNGLKQVIAVVERENGKTSDNE